MLLHHCWGEVNGKRGQWGHAIGGMGAITQAMARACAARGVEIRVGSPVSAILIEKGRAAGVVTAKGETIAARAVVSNLHPKLTFEQLVASAALPADFRARIAAYRSGSGSFRMNLALAELPSFSALPGHAAAEHHGAGIVIAPSLAYMERAFFDARLSGWSAKPIVEMLIPSTLDDLLAPPGRHVASLFCQHVAPELPDGRSWDEAREAVADLMVETVETYAPGFKSSIIARQISRPSTSSATSASSAATSFMGSSASTSSIRRGPSSGTPTIARPFRASTCAAPRPIPAAASPAPLATTRRARCCVTRATGHHDPSAGWRRTAALGET